jgi:hypothetical protein
MGHVKSSTFSRSIIGKVHVTLIQKVPRQVRTHVRGLARARHASGAQGVVRHDTVWCDMD